MPVLVDARPGGLNLLFRPGNTFTVVMNWAPSGVLDGRSFTATLNGQPLDLTVVGDTMTIVADDVLTGGLTLKQTYDWLLLEDIDGTDEPIITGRWTASDSPAASQGQTVQVTQGGATVNVNVLGATTNTFVGGAPFVADPGAEGDGELLVTTGGAIDYAADLTMAEVVFSGDGTAHDGLIRRVHSIQIPWNYTQSVDPTDSAIGTAMLVDGEVTLVDPPGLSSPSFQTGHFGPRCVFQFETLVRWARTQSLINLAPNGYGDFLTHANAAGVPLNLTPSWGFLAARSTMADGATVTIGRNDYHQGGAAFVDSAIWGTVDGGTLDGLSGNYEAISFLTKVGLQGNTSIRRRIGFVAGAAFLGIHPDIPNPMGEHWSGVGTFDPTSSGTVQLDEEIGLEVQEFTLGDLKIGVDSFHPILAGEGFFGGRDPGDDVLIGSTLDADRGHVVLRDRVELLPEGLVNTTTDAVRLLAWQASEVTLADAAGGFRVGNELSGLLMQGTVVFQEAGGVLGSGNVVSAALTLKNPPAVAQTITRYVGMTMQANVQGDGAVVTATGTAGLFDNPQFTVINGGMVNASDVDAIDALGNVAAGVAVTTRRGLRMRDPGGAGTIGSLVGVDIAALTRGATNIGIRNASTEVATPGLVGIDSAGDTIPATSKVKRLNNTTGAGIALTSNPTIPGGEDGQLLILFCSSAQPVTLTNGNNLRLGAATRELTQGDSLMLLFSTTLGDWVEVAYAGSN